MGLLDKIKQKLKGMVPRRVSSTGLTSLTLIALAFGGQKRAESRQLKSFNAVIYH